MYKGAGSVQVFVFFSNVPLAVLHDPIAIKMHLFPSRRSSGGNANVSSTRRKNKDQLGMLGLADNTRNNTVAVIGEFVEIGRAHV